ncbi:hypothetical protein AB0L57_30540 [Nocardia sp. NPDC052254]|uniref:hypothetical protein n=1 Tax=Nocardia sp. NPDC052254 TaxID=3155681 RepID=UPI0034448A68
MQLLSVFQGNRFRDHTLYRSARSFVLLHLSRVQTTDAELIREIDLRRGELADEVNEWSADLGAPERQDVATTIASLGQVVDRLAQAWVEANHAVGSANVETGTTHRYWLQLAELIGGYNTLVRTLFDGRYRQPAQLV